MDPVSGSVIAEQAQTLAQHDFSLWALFLRADLVVKLVMIGLIVASIWSWAIIFEKIMLVKNIVTRADAFEDLFWSGDSLQNLYRKTAAQADHPMARVFHAGMREWLRSEQEDKPLSQMRGLHQRIDRMLTVSISREMAQLEKRMLFLATVGAVAPFVGLFGTVWGIMNSFQAIALSRDTNLAVVAPGIAEALFATGLGLLAAIPAVIAYNKFTTDLAGYANRLDVFADEFSSLFSRQLDLQDK